MPRLLLTAQNFAFGPISKLLYIAEFLRHPTNTLIFAGYGTSLELARAFPFDEIHEFDTEDVNLQSQLKSLVQMCDIVISSMDQPSLEVAQEAGIPAVWIDCLYWFWDAIPEAVQKSTLFIRERSVPLAVNRSDLSVNISNLITVGPIVRAIPDQARKRQALISYGGGEATYWYRFGEHTNYPLVITSILATHVDWNDYDRILVATSERIATSLRDAFPNINWEFTTLSQEQFLHELSQSSLLLTTAGLVTTQAAYISSTPTIFLPASNNAHYMLLDELRDLGLASASVHLADVMERVHIQGRPQSENLPEVLSQLVDLDQSPSLRSFVGEKLNELVRTKSLWERSSVEAGREFMSSLGWEGAPEAAARAILDLLRDKYASS